MMREGVDQENTECQYQAGSERQQFVGCKKLVEH
jgi:hypothetical protein